MKTFFVPAHASFQLDALVPHIAKLPKSVGIVTTIQYLGMIDGVQKLLEEAHVRVVVLGQILGCNWDNTLKSSDFEAFFYIGSGRFHPLGLGLISEKRILTYNPQTDIFGELDRNDVVNYKKRKMTLLAKFLTSERIGVLLSVKEGQAAVHDAFSLEKHFPEKKFYIFACSTLDYTELENYPFIDIWVNTMCPRIGTDDYQKVRKGMVNLKDLSAYVKT